MPVSRRHSPPAPETNAVPVNFDYLLRELDAQCAALKSSQPSPSHLSKPIERFQFSYEGIEYAIHRLKRATSERFIISASVGYLPFSIEAPERRQALLAIIEATRTLPNLQFAVDHAGKISAAGLFDVPSLMTPDFLFYPLTLFLREAQPFMLLIRKYL
jgi:hypothetical protein